MSKKYNLYLGKAGQLAAMASFLVRGWNVATPEVDVGDDLFVVEDQKGIFFRAQVKTSTAVERNSGYSARFNLPISQLQFAIDPEIYYVFIIFFQYEPLYKVIIRRDALLRLYEDKSLGSLYHGRLMLYFSFQNEKVTCSDVDITQYLNNFDDFPIIEH